MIRSLYIKLLLSAMLVVGLLIALLVSLEYESYRNEQAKFIQQELQRDLSRMFSTTQRLPPRASASKAFSAIQLDWPNRLVDAVVCDVDGNRLWQDINQLELLTVRKLCQRLLPFIGPRESQFRLVKFDTDAPYYLYSLRVTRYFDSKKPKTFHTILLRPASDLVAQADHYLVLTLRRALLIYLGVAVLFLLSTRWGLASLNRIKSELDTIRNGEKDEMDSQYEKELQPLTQSLNRLLDNERQQKQRYQHTVNDLAHSLKTRLALIQATMAEEKLSAKARRNLNEQVSLMDQIIQYHLRRAVTGRQLLNNQGCDPVPIAQKLLATMAKVYQHKRIRVVFETDDDLLFHGEQDDLFELLGNLLDNAHKFAISEIHLELRHITAGLQIVLNDDGPGVPEEQRERILQRGVRADNSSGQGIGLGVCSEIVHSYHGQLLVSDSELGGACFSILLPGRV
jgi:two-component system, OmpR family, sensor histidine kinase PhoQ